MSLKKQRSKAALIRRLMCPPAAVICPFTEVSTFERLSQLQGQRVQVRRGETSSAGVLRNVFFNNGDVTFTVNGTEFRFAAITSLALLQESTRVRTFLSLLVFRQPRRSLLVRLITRGPGSENNGAGYAEIIRRVRGSATRFLIPSSRIERIECLAGRFSGKREQVTAAERLHSLIGKEIFVENKQTRGQAAVILTVDFPNVTIRDSFGRVLVINVRTTPTLFHIRGDFTRVLTLVTVRSTRGGIDLTMNLNRIGKDFIEISSPTPPFLYLLIPLNRFITVECATEDGE